MKFKFLLCASAALLPALPAFAQDVAAPAGDQEIVIADLRRTDIVVVASGIEEMPENVGRAVTLIERDEIERRQTVALADLLSTTPGVTVSRNGGLGGFTGVRIRGAEAEHTLVLIDGVRVNDPSSPGGGFDFGNLLAGSIKRVEVLRGANSVVWGSQAIGGVVNVVTQDGSYGLTASGNAEYGSQDSLFANAALGYGGQNVRAGFTAGYARTDGISAAASGTEPDGYRQFGASGRFAVDLTPDLTIDLRGYYADSRTDLDGFPPPTYAFSDTVEYSTAEELYGYAGINARLFGDVLRNRLSVSLARIDRDNYDPAFGTTPSFIGRGRSERYEYQGQLRPVDAVTAVFGAEHEDSRFNDGSTFASTGVTSFYGQAIVTPFDAATLTAGIRNDDHKAFGNHTTFGFSASVRPAYGTVLRGSYSEGFKAPTLYQLYSFYGTRTLRPETSKGYDLSAEQQLLDGVLRLKATWFHRDTSNQIDFDLGTFTYANLARTRAEGVEIELGVDLLEGLHLRGNYTHVATRNRAGGANYGKELARRPRDSASLSADYRFGENGPSIGGTVTIVGRSFDNPANSVRLDGYTLASIRGEVPLGERLALYGRVENLFDTKYQTVATYGTPGRSAHGGVRVRFN
ncbi:TonB-dependent receptor plug domain-containing protein [Sphingomonas soli]|uniref:TonB-dependent receptor plug domain-containing protein n=1 Tax=Sphingomonas soli TaxID=266127 RepID=UPI00083596B5|nr:TonB-dependent receptor [Sphingomonas soli]